ncbi:MAG: OmpP1/FadL family transporter, partial [Gammaproteobacteria bacterium]|nr:OmpP1/FadL family transporter [Gammaproteobacteria bacterium]
YSTQSSAGGYQIPEMSIKGMGMGNAFTAVADDASAIWFNPAGIAFQKGKVLTIGGDIIKPSHEFTPNGGSTTYSAKERTFFVPHGYITYNSPEHPVVFGLGINSPFGLSTNWRNSGAPFASESTAVKMAKSVSFSEIKMANINPTIAYKINDRLSIGGGISYYHVDEVHLDNQILLLEGDGNGWGANFGLMYKADRFDFGLNYRSQVKADIDGVATGGPDLGVLGAAALIGVTSTAKTSVTFPDIFNIGVAYRPDNKLLLSFDLDWTRWETFDSIDITYGTSALNAITGANSSIAENWKNTLALRMGAEWKYNNKFKSRIGYVFDPTPIRDTDFSPRLPGEDRQLITLGFGYEQSQNLTIDMAYAYVWLDDRNQTASSAVTTSYNGEYKGNTHIFSASLTYRF